MLEGLTILATFVFGLFAFSFGACFGSFLNVVVWRMPRGKPILLDRSHCPKCQQPIPGKDNIPIFGWLMLRGKCRNCQLPISIRYPLVEFAVAVMVAGLFLLIVVAHGETLPAGWLTKHYGGWLSELPRCPLLVVFLHQSVLGYFLLGISLIDEDRMKTPWRWTAVAVLLHFLFLWVTPAVGQMDALAAQSDPEMFRENLGTFSQGAIYGGLGVVMAFLIAGVSRLLKTPHHFTNGLQSLALLGLFLGPVVVLFATMVAAISLVSQWVMLRFSKRPAEQISGISTQLLLAWLIIICSWNWWPKISLPI